MWKALLADGHEVSELTHDWNDICGSVVELKMLWNGAEYSLPPNMPKYIHFKTGAFTMGQSEVTVISRSIGYQTDAGDSVILCFKEDGSSVSVETRS